MEELNIDENALDRDHKFMLVCYKILEILETNMHNNLRACSIMRKFVSENFEEDKPDDECISKDGGSGIPEIPEQSEEE